MTPLQHRDLQHIWHPCAQMKDYESFPPLEVVSAQGPYFTLASGQKMIDAIASWWCKSLGHGHPVLKQAVQQQLDHFEHVLLANVTHEPVVKLAENLANLTPSLDKMLFASDGSCAVEMALKMSAHIRMLRNQPHKTHFAYLQNGYHGETIATMSVSDLGLYRQPYENLFADNTHGIHGVPYVSGIDDPLWSDASEVWPDTEKQLNVIGETLTAIIIEPLLQGAAGMLVYSADWLKRLRAWCDANDVYLIADEIMTGMGRTGKWLACQHASIEPDFLCVAKGVTAGWLPLSVMLTRSEIYQAFYDDYETGKAFMHSHTHTGNGLAVAVANAVFEVMRTENTLDYVNDQLAPHMLRCMQQVAKQTGKLHNLRQLGAMVAADLRVDRPGRWGYAIYQEAVKRGALLRPLGNALYWFLPLNTPLSVVDELAEIMEQAITKMC